MLPNNLRGRAMRTGFQHSISMSESHSSTGFSASCMEMVMLTTTQANSAKSDASPRNSEHSQTDGGDLMKILVVDDHFLVRAALHSILQEFRNQVVILE